MTPGPKLYIIHFRAPFHHARHYVGITDQTIEDRLARHQAGRGAKLTAAVMRSGIGFDQIFVLGEFETMRQARDAEIRIKKHKKAQSHWPICKSKVL